MWHDDWWAIVHPDRSGYTLVPQGSRSWGTPAGQLSKPFVALGPFRTRELARDAARTYQKEAPDA